MKAIKSTFSLAAAALLIGAGSAAQAATVTAVDLNTVALGAVDPSAPLMTTSFSNGLGDLTSVVYFNSSSSIYSYILSVDANHNNISEFNTGFEVLGFNGVAGFDFNQSASAGGAGAATDFIIEHDSDGTLDWGIQEVSGNKDWFDAGETITFFFQSTYAPNAIDLANMINHAVGSANTYAFVPTPTAAVIGLPMLGLMALGRRRRSQK